MKNCNILHWTRKTLCIPSRCICIYGVELWVDHTKINLGKFNCFYLTERGPKSIDIHSHIFDEAKIFTLEVGAALFNYCICPLPPSQLTLPLFALGPHNKLKITKKIKKNIKVEKKEKRCKSLIHTRNSNFGHSLPIKLVTCK